MRHRRWLLSDIIHDYCQLTINWKFCNKLAPPPPCRLFHAKPLSEPMLTSCQQNFQFMKKHWKMSYAKYPGDQYQVILLMTPNTRSAVRFKISLNVVGRFVFNDAIRTIWRWGGQGLWIPYPRGSTPYPRPYFPPLFLVQNSDFFRFHHPRPSDPRRFGVIGSWSLVCEFNFIITHIDSAQFSQLPSQSSGAYWQPEKVGSTETWLRSCCRSCVRIFQELSSSLIYGRTDGSKA